MIPLLLLQLISQPPVIGPPIVLVWDAVPGAAGYTVHLRTSVQDDPTMHEVVEKGLTWTFNYPHKDVRYFFSVSAYHSTDPANGNHRWLGRRSEEVSALAGGQAVIPPWAVEGTPVNVEAVCPDPRPAPSKNSEAKPIILTIRSYTPTVDRGGLFSMSFTIDGGTRIVKTAVLLGPQWFPLEVGEGRDGRELHMVAWRLLTFEPGAHPLVLTATDDRGCQGRTTVARTVTVR